MTRRNEVFQVRCTAEEKARWTARAKAAGLDLSTLVRDCLRRAPAKDDQYAVIAELGKAKPQMVSLPVMKIEKEALTDFVIGVDLASGDDDGAITVGKVNPDQSITVVEQKVGRNLPEPCGKGNALKCSCPKCKAFRGQK